jgi:PD-(D/E)XK nuclease superfamily protein
MTLQTFSASRIKAYKTCARLYKNKYIIHRNERQEEDKNVASLLGLSLHKAIESHYKHGKSATAVFQNTMTATLDEWENSGVIIKGLEYLARSLKTGKDILNVFPWDDFNPIELEYNFTLPFPNKEAPIVLINGIIDCLDMNGSVIDWKSASYAPIQDELDNDIQFILYAWAYEQMHGEKPWKVIWYHLRTQTPIEANIAYDYDMKIEQLIEDILAMLNPTQHYARKNMDKFCRENCSFYASCFGLHGKDQLVV